MKLVAPSGLFMSLAGLDSEFPVVRALAVVGSITNGLLWSRRWARPATTTSDPRPRPGLRGPGPPHPTRSPARDDVHRDPAGHPEQPSRRGSDLHLGHRPGRGALTIKQRRGDRPYAVAEFACGWDGRAVRMVKAAGEAGSDREEEAYDGVLRLQRPGPPVRLQGVRVHRPLQARRGPARALQNGWLDLAAGG